MTKEELKEQLENLQHSSNCPLNITNIPTTGEDVKMSSCTCDYIFRFSDLIAKLGLNEEFKDILFLRTGETYV